MRATGMRRVIHALLRLSNHNNKNRNHGGSYIIMNITAKKDKAAGQKAFWSDRNFALEAVRVTEAAALASVRWMGRGLEKEADKAAVNAMREALNGLSIDGTV